LEWVIRMESTHGLLELKKEVEACRRDCPARGKGAWFFEPMGRIKGFLGASKIMFVAPKPSTGTFPSPNDELFYKLLGKHNLQNAHITDWIKCRGKSGSQTDAEFANCLDFLLRERRIIKPLILVGVGNETLNRIQGCKPLREGVHCLEHCIHYGAQFRTLESIRIELDRDLARISHLYGQLLGKEKTQPVRGQNGLDDALKDILVISINRRLARKFSLLHEAIVEKMATYELRRGKNVEKMDKSAGYDLKVNGVKIRVFISNHEGGIMSESGVAISKKGFFSMSGEDLLRVVSIPEKKYQDYCIRDFTFRNRPEPELRSMLYAGMTRKQKQSLLYDGTDFEFAWI